MSVDNIDPFLLEIEFFKNTSCLFLYWFRYCDYVYFGKHFMMWPDDLYLNSLITSSKKFLTNWKSQEDGRCSNNQTPHSRGKRIDVVGFHLWLQLILNGNVVLPTSTWKEVVWERLRNIRFADEPIFISPSLCPLQHILLVSLPQSGIHNFHNILTSPNPYIPDRD